MSGVFCLWSFQDFEVIGNCTVGVLVEKGGMLDKISHCDFFVDEIFADRTLNESSEQAAGQKSETMHAWGMQAVDELSELDEKVYHGRFMMLF